MWRSYLKYIYNFLQQMFLFTKVSNLFVTKIQSAIGVAITGRMVSSHFSRLFVGLSIKLAVTEQNLRLKLSTDFSNWYLIFFQQFFRKFLHSWLETHFWNQSFQKNRIWKRRKIPTWNQLQYWTQTQIST